MNKEDVYKKRMGEIAALMREKDDFIITAHVNPDPDALGSEIALYLLLKKLCRQARVINASAVPRIYTFIDGRNIIETYDPSVHDGPISSAGALFILDAASYERVGPHGSILEASHAATICIDHHMGTDGCGDINLIDPRASSVGEIIFELCECCSFEIDGEIARSLYLAILADTRSFQFNNTAPGTHRAAARLLELGVNPEDMYEALYERNTMGEALLLGLALKGLTIECGGRMAWMKVTRAMQQSVGATANNSDYFLNFLRSIEGVDVMLLFRDIGGGKTKVSLRGKRGMDVNSIARAFGGGGHLQASGISLHEPLDEVVEKVLAKARNLFQDPENKKCPRITQINTNRKES